MNKKQVSKQLSVAEAMPPIFATSNDRVLRFDEVHQKTGLCRAHVHALAAQGRFPKPLKLVPGGRASGWLESEINKWIADRAASRDDGPHAAWE